MYTSAEQLRIFSTNLAEVSLMKIQQKHHNQLRTLHIDLTKYSIFLLCWVE